jgi:hypothetical protein
MLTSMWQMFREGGIGMLVIAILGSLTLAIAVSFAARPSEPKRGFVLAMVAAIAMSAVGSTARGLSMCTYASTLCREMGSECRSTPHAILVEGAGEALNNLTLGALVLALVAVVYAFGRMRGRLSPGSP